jgi:predicted metallopeptidase
MIKYELAEDIMKRLLDITRVLGMEHVRLSGVYAIRSHGSGSARTIARCHALSKIWQLALKIDAVYLIEVISEKFDRMSLAEQDKVLIHELMHIPLSFGGGFKHHDFVTHRNVEKIYEHYILSKNNPSIELGFVDPVNQVKQAIKKHELKKKGIEPPEFVFYRKQNEKQKKGFRSWFG